MQGDTGKQENILDWCDNIFEARFLLSLNAITAVLK